MAVAFEFGIVSDCAIHEKEPMSRIKNNNFWKVFFIFKNF